MIHNGIAIRVSNTKYNGKLWVFVAKVVPTRMGLKCTRADGEIIWIRLEDVVELEYQD